MLAAGIGYGALKAGRSLLEDASTILGPEGGRLEAGSIPLELPAGWVVALTVLAVAVAVQAAAAEVHL